MQHRHVRHSRPSAARTAFVSYRVECGGGGAKTGGDRVSSVAARPEPDAILVVCASGRGVLPRRVRDRASRLAPARLELRDEARRPRGDAARMHVRNVTTVSEADVTTP